MTAVRTIGLSLLVVFGAWLLYRVDRAIGDQALLLVFGGVVGVAMAALVAVIVWVVADVRRERTQTVQEGPQDAEWRAPVVVYLADAQAARRQSHPAPAGLFAQPQRVGERENWVDGQGWAR